MKRTLSALALALCLGLALTGCGRPAPGEGSDRVYEVTQTLTDGRSVVCLVYKAGYAGGLSCNWSGAR